MGKNKLQKFYLQERQHLMRDRNQQKQVKNRLQDNQKTKVVKVKSLKLIKVLKRHTYMIETINKIANQS